MASSAARRCAASSWSMTPQTHNEEGMASRTIPAYWTVMATSIAVGSMTPAAQHTKRYTGGSAAATRNSHRQRRSGSKPAVMITMASGSTA